MRDQLNESVVGYTPGHFADYCTTLPWPSLREIKEKTKEKGRRGGGGGGRERGRTKPEKKPPYFKKNPYNNRGKI